MSTQNMRIENPGIGQVWRRNTGKLVKIERVGDDRFPWINWRGVDGRGYGSLHVKDFIHTHKIVEEPTE